MTPPKALLFDFGGTLVEERGVDIRAGNEWLLSRASRIPDGVTLDDVLERARRIGREVVTRRDERPIETPWPALSRLIHGHFGIEFTDPIDDLELGFWQASVNTSPIPGVRDALERLAASDLPMAVVSNTSFSARTLGAELEKHGLRRHLSFIITSSEYSVRKPNVLLFELAARRLGVHCQDIWFVGDRLDTDVAGANAVGMVSVWLTTGDDAAVAAGEGAAVRPTVSVRNWGDLVRHLPSQHGTDLEES